MALAKMLYALVFKAANAVLLAFLLLGKSHGAINGSVLLNFTPEFKGAEILGCSSPRSLVWAYL